MNRREIAENVRALVEPTVRAVGCEVLDVEMLGSESRPTIRITLDHEQGVSIEHCAEVSRRVSPLLDVEDLISGSYQLEVSSPGLDRPLKRLMDFDRFQDKRAKIETRNPVVPGRNQRRFVGKLRGSRDQNIELEEEGGQLISIPFTAIERAHLIYEFGEEDFGNRGKSHGPSVPRRRSDRGAKHGSSDPSRGE
ncbi:MAG: ribosome maturation factor RimP [bacterium]